MTLLAGTPLAEYERDYRAESYVELLEASTRGAGVPDTIAGVARLLDCGRQHADTVRTNLARKGLIALAYDEGSRVWGYVATPAGRDVLRSLPMGA